MILDFQQNLLQFITPAIILSVAIFLVRIFGKVISEQKPFTNDRALEREFSGLWFFVDFILLPGIIALAFLVYFGQSITNWLESFFIDLGPITFHWIIFMLVFLIGVYYAFTAVILKEEKYKMMGVLGEKRNFMRIASINAALLQPSALLLIFILGIEIISQNLLWISILLIQVFIVFVEIASNYSLAKYYFPKINIYFANKGKPLRGVMLIKVDTKNIIVRDASTISIINKEHVFKWEVIDSEQEPYIKNPMIPFVTWVPLLLTLYLLWKNKLVMALVLGIILPTIISMIGQRLLGISQRNKKNLKDDFSLKNIDNYPVAMKVASLVFLLASIAGYFSAWHHNLRFTVILGIVLPFISWVIFVYSSQLKAQIK